MKKLSYYLLAGLCFMVIVTAANKTDLNKSNLKEKLYLLHTVAYLEPKKSHTVVTKIAGKIDWIIKQSQFIKKGQQIAWVNNEQWQLKQKKYQLLKQKNSLELERKLAAVTQERNILLKQIAKLYREEEVVHDFLTVGNIDKKSRIYRESKKKLQDIKQEIAKLKKKADNQKFWQDKKLLVKEENTIYLEEKKLQFQRDKKLHIVTAIFAGYFERNNTLDKEDVDEVKAGEILGQIEDRNSFFIRLDASLFDAKGIQGKVTSVDLLDKNFKIITQGFFNKVEKSRQRYDPDNIKLYWRYQLKVDQKLKPKLIKILGKCNVKLYRQFQQPCYVISRAIFFSKHQQLVSSVGFEPAIKKVYPNYRLVFMGDYEFAIISK